MSYDYAVFPDEIFEETDNNNTQNNNQQQVDVSFLASQALDE